MDAGKWHRWDGSFLRRVEDNLRPFLSTASPHLKVVVGVSGGVDSLVLLHCLKRILGAETLLVAHVNHQLRAEADGDADFVAEIADSWGIAFAVQRVNVGQLATEQGWSVEEAGRKARYTFFAQMAETHRPTAVSVAHNADDQAETVLLHLLRGSGLAGLRGMQTVGAVPGNDQLILLRPLLHTSRADIEKYARIHGLQFREDVSNQDTTYFRNRIRHELLPLLQTYTPKIKRHLQQLSEIVSADYDFLKAEFRLLWERMLLDEGDGWVQISRQQWQALPLSQKRMALRVAILRIRPLQTEISFEVIEQARQLCEQNVSGTQIDLPGKVTLFVNYNTLIFTTDAQQIPFSVPQIKAEGQLSIPGKIALQNGWQLEATVYEGDIIQEADELSVFVDVGNLPYLDVRGRMAGERIRPLGMAGHSVKVKKVMINRKMIRPFRANWPIIASNAHPIWIVGHMIDHRAKIKDVTQKIVQLRCFQDDV